MSGICDVSRQLDQTSISLNNKENRGEGLTLFGIDILKMKPCVVPAQWYIDYTDDADDENGEEGDGGKPEVTFDGLLSRMSRLEQELSDYDVESPEATGTMRTPEATGTVDTSEFAIVKEPVIEVGEDCAYELETEPELEEYLEGGRRRSLSEGDGKSIRKYHSTKNKYKKTSQPPRPFSENVLSRSLGDLLTLSTSLSIFSTDETTDRDEDDAVESKPDDAIHHIPKLSVARKSISVDLYSDDAKSHRRRNGLNLIDEQDDALTDLDKFQQSIRKGGKPGGLRPGFAQSLESLIKAEKADKVKKSNFITRLISKPPRHMDSLREEGSSSDPEISAQNIRIMKDSVRKISKVIQMRVNEKGELIRTVEIHKTQNQSLGFFIKFGDGIDRDDGIFISRVTLGSLADTNNLLHTGDEIIKINQVDVAEKTLEDVVSTMQQAGILIIETRSALPFDTHAINVREKSKDAMTTNKGGAGPRTSSVLHPRSLFPGDTGPKKRSYTAFDDNLFYKANACDTRDQSKPSIVSRDTSETNLMKMNETNNYDASSSSDSDELNQSEESDVPTFESDCAPAHTHLGIGGCKSFTGKLAVNISTISGISPTEATGASACYCTIEINQEFKAKTRLHHVTTVVMFDDDFDIDIQVANVLTIKLFQEQRILADKCLATSNILLQKVLHDDNHKKFILSCTKDNIHTRLNVKFTEARRHLERRQSSRASGIFGFNLSHTLSTEKNTIPILVRKCVGEIEKRGLDLEGIYRISGNARKKKELREQFEQNSYETDLNDVTIDCHVITGVLKDYLRKLPKPLISDKMYKIIHEKQQEVGPQRNNQRTMLSQMIKMAPYVNRATLIFIMDHFQRVIEHMEKNKMTGKNIAVCFGPVMLSPPIEEMKDFQKYIDALEFLISIWPMQTIQNMI